MRRVCIIIALVVFYFPLIGLCQQTGRMETDRPDQTESPFIVKKKYLQGELGMNREVTDNDITYVHPTLLWKYGVYEKLEIRLITAFTTNKLSNPLKTHSGLQPVQLGAKIALAEEKGILPKTSLIFHTGLPFVASKQYRTPHLSPNFRFTMQNTLTKDISVGYNLGAEWDGVDTTPAWIYTLATGFNLGEKWYSYAEIYGEVKKYNKPNHNLACGFAYYINDNLKADISGGSSISLQKNWYSAIGLSFRVK